MRVWFVVNSLDEDDYVCLSDLVLFASEVSANSYCVNKQFEDRQAHEARENKRYARWLAQKEAWNCLVENGIKASEIFPWSIEFKRREWRRLPLEIRSLIVYP